MASRPEPDSPTETGTGDEHAWPLLSDLEFAICTAGAESGSGATLHCAHASRSPGPTQPSERRAPVNGEARDPGYRTDPEERGGLPGSLPGARLPELHLTRSAFT